MLALVPNELPFYFAYWLVGSTALALLEGDLDSTGGLVAFGVALLGGVAVVVVVRRAFAARVAVDEALTEGLGVAARGHRHRVPWARVLLLPWLMRDRAVERTADISYGDGGRRNQLDVYRHRSVAPYGPTLVYFHGGGFGSGHKNREARPLINRLARQGWVCISANYRLSPEVSFPEHLIDAKRVIAWAREHGPELGADPTRVVVAGSSAGAHLAAMATLTPNDPAFQPGFEAADTAVSAAVCLYGYFGPIDDGIDRPSTPFAYAGNGVVPFFVAHGSNDTLVPVGLARRFVDRLRQSAGRPVVYAELPGGQHSFDLFHSIRFETVVDGIEDFAAATAGIRA